jgi:hypothetical protein
MEQRFIKHLQKTDTCWNWTGSCLITGYGCFRINQKTYRSHRIAYELWVNPIPKGQLVRHKCDNRKCCNPNHLELGTHQDNSNDAKERGRTAKGIKNGLVLHPEKRARGERQGCAVLTDDEAREIKILLSFELSNKYIAIMYNICPTIVSKIKTNKCYTHI